MQELKYFALFALFALNVINLYNLSKLSSPTELMYLQATTNLLSYV